MAYVSWYAESQLLANDRPAVGHIICNHNHIYNISSWASFSLHWLPAPVVVSRPEACLPQQVQQRRDEKCSHYESVKQHRKDQVEGELVDAGHGGKQQAAEGDGHYDPSSGDDRARLFHAKSNSLPRTAAKPVVFRHSTEQEDV